MKRTFLPLLVFIGGSLVGPAFRAITWPFLISSGENISDAGKAFEAMTYDIVFLLWPAQMLAVSEVSMGRPAALLIAVFGNLLVFVLFGAIASILIRKTNSVPIALGLLFLVVAMLAFWGAGFDYKFVNVWALLIALGYYGALVFLTGRLMLRA